MNAPRPSTVSWTFVDASPDAEVFQPPSHEALRTYQRLGGLCVPRTPMMRAFRDAIVAPYAHFTLINVRQQLYLYDIFHLGWSSRIGHFVGFHWVNAVIGAVLVRATGSPWAAVAWVSLLAVWYAVMARSVGLFAWWLVSLVQLGFVLALALAHAAVFGPSGLFVAWLAGAWIVAGPHMLEPLPPRSGEPDAWSNLPDFVRGPEHARLPLAESVRRVVRMLPGPVIGLTNETLSSPRLLPYGALRLMMAFGYAPALKEEHDAWLARAWASGNPAIDYIGIGGATELELTEAGKGTAT
ncbi:MAG: hypothetical protein EP330_28290 [Deltaproteobacteria bacterium]|nr:MAG: hypothetical protein EP330_28290 [Deltaproteobacteria bacterium]